MTLALVALAAGAFFGWNVGYSRGVRACMPRPRPRADIDDVDRRKRLGLSLAKLGSLGGDDRGSR